MTNSDILFKAINKAFDNGYEIPSMVTVEFSKKGFGAMEKIQYVIFSHDFARAFWGEKFINANLADGFIKSLNHKEYGATIMIDLKLRVKAWRFHLWQMAIADNPIKYLEQFVAD